jgi:K+-transporting ATPase ATPase C chain
VARENHLTDQQVRRLVDQQRQGRALGVLGEPTVNVLTLNLALRQATQH